MIKQYQNFTLKQDLNPAITAGIVWVILDILDEDTFEVEFVTPDGSNYEYEGQFTFTINSAMLR